MLPGRLWVDTEDFFEFFAANPRPSGIQRLAFEIMRELVRQAPGRVGFVRRGTGGSLLQEMPWAVVADLFTAGSQVQQPVTQPAPRRSRLRRAARAVSIRLPDSVRTPLIKAAVYQIHAAKSWRALAHMATRAAAIAPPGPESSGPEPDFAPGDMFLVLGAPWAVPGFAELLTALKQRHGVVATLLVYDLIPVRHPEWCTPHAADLFTTWLYACLPLFDRLMAISAHTAQDVAAFVAEQGWALARPVETIPIGAGFDAPQRSDPPGLPAPGQYVLFVSTIEARKNHAVLVRVWRRLIDDVRLGRRPADSVPQLVFAGRVGWLVADLMQQLDNMGWLQGRIRLIADPTDAELVALYRGCLFTIFPSLFEGWGLPVSESLALGVPCLASSAAALPEAGGTLCRYFDPNDAGSAYAAVVALLDDRPALAAWRTAVQDGFRPVPWSATAQAVLNHSVLNHSVLNHSVLNQAVLAEPDRAHAVP